jgi:ferredoxin
MRRMFHSLVMMMVSVTLCYGAKGVQAFVPVAVAVRFFDPTFMASPLPTATAMVTSSSEDLSSFAKTTRSQSSSIFKVIIPKPLGIVLEEVSADDDLEEAGVQIVQVHSDGNAAKQPGSISGPLCVHDKVQAVNGDDVSTAAFDTVMEKIIASGTPVELTLRRPPGSVVVEWDNGICVAAQPGDYLGNAAIEAGMKIQYSCRSGSCGICEQSVSLDNGKEHRYCRPCSFRIPKGVHSMKATPSDRFVSF